MVPPPPPVARPGPAAASPQQTSPRPTSPAAAAASLRPFVTAPGLRIHWLPGSRRPRLPAVCEQPSGTQPRAPPTGPLGSQSRAAGAGPLATPSDSPLGYPPDPCSCGSRWEFGEGPVGAGSSRPRYCLASSHRGHWVCLGRWVCLGVSRFRKRLWLLDALFF